jgi:SPP1 gp7 family putative phage head morphogenesis protein
VKVTKIIASSRRGLFKHEQEYRRRIAELFDYDEALRRVEDYTRTQTKELLDDIWDQLNRRLVELSKYLEGLFSTVYEHGGSKVMDKQGKFLRFATPTYKGAVGLLVKDNLLHVQKLANKQREVMIKAIEQGVKTGQTYNQIAQTATAQAKDLAFKRARTIARTEISRANSQAMMDVMKQNGISKYVWVAATTGTPKPCPVCLNFHRKRYDIGNGPLPVKDTHPNCRCVVVAA